MEKLKKNFSGFLTVLNLKISAEAFFKISKLFLNYLKLLFNKKFLK